MTNNPITRTRELRTAHRKAADAAAEAEANLALAEAALAEARRDDGVIDVAKLDARIAKAEAPVRLARIQADRAAAALASIEDELDREIYSLATSTRSMLSDANTKSETTLIEELSPRLWDPNGHSSKSALLNFLEFISPIADRNAVACDIDNAVRGHRLGVGSIDSICEAIEAAGPLV